MPLPCALAVLVYAATSAGAPEAGLRARLTSALRSHGATIVDHAVEVALTARLAGWRSIDELGFLSRGRSALERGRRARERVELDAAEALLAQAEAAYDEGLALAGVASLAADAALEHGVALAELGRADDARAAFRRALSMDAGVALTERNARPDVVRLFVEVVREGARPHVVVEPKIDALATSIETLRVAPSRDGVDALIGVAGFDGAIVAAVSADGRRMLAMRVVEDGTSAVLEASGLLGTGGDAAIDELAARLVAAPLVRTRAPLELHLDDHRLEPTTFAATPRPPKKRAWPWVFAGALGVTAAIIGVTIGVVASDARYAVKVDGASFGK